MDSARQKFSEQYQYSAVSLREDYMKEIELFDSEFWELPQRAARLSAAVKRFKTSSMIAFVIDVAEENDLDITPGLAKKLCVNYFARSGSQKILVAVFGRAGREDKSASNNEEIVVQMTVKYREEANQYWKKILRDIRDIQREYKEEIERKS